MERFFYYFFVFVFSFELRRKSNVWISKQKLIILLYLITAVKCLVFTKENQKNIYMSRYCPKMEYCAEGTHVMCMYYNPNIIMGPHCGEGQNITITPELVELMLDIVNQIRSTVAKGLETGKNGERLPKAYGMLRLRWDKELATFAQIWANQCIIQHDLCRATKRFSNPAQLVSLVRFTYPDWRLVSGHDNSSLSNNNDGLTMNKLKHTIRTTMKISYVRKNQVTKEMIENFPDLTKMSHLASVRVFMTMIHPGSTHMGCGLSAYADYYGKRESQSVIVNSVQVVCNFSTQPKVGARVYEMKPAPGTSARCGCPPDTIEDEDCLCVARSSPADEEIRTCSNNDPGCTPSLVLLPIIKVENAPPEKLYNPRLGNHSYFRNGPIEAVSIYQPENNNFFHDQLRPAILKLTNANMPKSVANLDTRISDYESRRFRDVRDRYFDKQFFIPGHRYRNGGSLGRDSGYSRPNKVHQPSHKNSIFTRVSKFKLTQQNKHIDNIPIENFAIKKRAAIKKDVKARKDFSSIKSIASEYLSRKYANYSINNLQNHVVDIVDTNTPKFGIAGFNISRNNFEIKTSNEETDNKLLTLLDNLEEEVKHIELNNNIKEMIDVKIRKIYGNVVGDPNLLLKPKATEIVDDLIHNVEKKSDKKDETLPENADIIPEVKVAPQRRRQNAIVYENSMYEPFIERRKIYDKKDRESYRNLDLRYYNEDGERRFYKNFGNIKKDDYYFSDDDILGVQRRNYYQQKLDNMERKLKSIRSYSHRSTKNKARYVRPLVTNGVEAPKYSNRVNDFYMPDDAKFLHGF